MTRPSEPPTRPENANYYAVLRLQPPPTVLTAAAIKKAYHAALLRHHPDKHSSSPTSTSSPSIDQITAAYKALSSLDLRREYNATLTLSSTGTAGSEVVQAVDLDEFTYEEEKDGGRYVKSCRCGEEKGFVIKDVELEQVADEGGREVVVGCVGCSLWWRVGFEVLDE